jgi:hypothetical protein
MNKLRTIFIINSSHVKFVMGLGLKSSKNKTNRKVYKWNIEKKDPKSYLEMHLHGEHPHQRILQK